MELKKVLVHTCFQIGKGFNEDQPLSPKKCRCRQWVAVPEATKNVELGLAQYVVIKREEVEVEEVCNNCTGAENLKKSCDQCGKTGLVKVKVYRLIRGEDIIFISLDGKTNSKTTQVKKSPTIEKAHIERAYIDGNEEEQARIDVYGIMNKEFVTSLIVGFEPVDDPVKMTGRKYDWGRKI